MKKKSIHFSYSLQSGLNHCWWQSSSLFALAGLGTLITWVMVSGGGKSQSLPVQSPQSGQWQFTEPIPQGVPEAHGSIIPDLPEVEKAIQEAEAQKALLSQTLPLPAPIPDGRSLLRERLQSLPPPVSPIRFARPEPVPLRPGVTGVKPARLAMSEDQPMPIQRETPSALVIQRSIPSGVVENRVRLTNLALQQGTGQSICQGEHCAIAGSPPDHRPNTPAFVVTGQPIKLSPHQPQRVTVLPHNTPLHSLEGQITVQDAPELEARVVVKNSGQDSPYFVVTESLKMAHRLHQKVDRQNLPFTPKNTAHFDDFGDNPLVLVQQFGLNLEQIKEAIDQYQAQRQWLFYLREDGMEDDPVI
ncbi:hypothetical protein K4A83_07165 [Spirulina subsalsa FACHB-351]|uniref:Uncharacterized protein n=1 Tax=Spirulina subsalsa FACHB-351 TaxID=234711 RepID=A0ABT3L3H3_9CYAN|nr:hypothetical protein [Spirulina subsalsa]MCW6036052.1 hypothetical protein [Spirulina subsalsa FACHB-351]